MFSNSCLSITTSVKGKILCILCKVQLSLQSSRTPGKIAIKVNIIYQQKISLRNTAWIKTPWKDRIPDEVCQENTQSKSVVYRNNFLDWLVLYEEWEILFVCIHICVSKNCLYITYLLIYFFIGGDFKMADLRQGVFKMFFV